MQEPKRERLGNPAHAQATESLFTPVGRLLAMRHLVLPLLLLSLPLASQNPSSSDKPKDLYTRGLNALTGSTNSVSVITEVDLIRRSAVSRYGPAQTSRGYIAETG